MVSYAWGNMQNGSTGLEALCVSVRGIKLFPEAARAAEAMAQAFEARFGKRLQFTEGFRPIGRPGDYENGNSNTQWYYWERWLLFHRINGAYPGGSIHGWGKAIDVNLTGLTDEQIEWLHTEARAFGWNWDTTGRVTGEPWHLDFNLPVTADVAGYDDGQITETPTPEGAPTMYLANGHTNAADVAKGAANVASIFLVQDGCLPIRVSGDEAAELNKLCKQDMKDLPDFEFNQLEVTIANVQRRAKSSI